MAAAPPLLTLGPLPTSLNKAALHRLCPVGGRATLALICLGSLSWENFSMLAASVHRATIVLLLVAVGLSALAFGRLQPSSKRDNNSRRKAVQRVLESFRTESGFPGAIAGVYCAD